MASASTGYRAGIGRRVITPRKPLWAGGYAHRDRPVIEAEHDLYAKALVLEDATGHRFVLVTTDLLGLPKAIADTVAARICADLGLDRSQLALTSSHTHSGPALRGSLLHVYPLEAAHLEAIARYSDELEQELVRVVQDAAAALQPASLAYGCGSAAFAVNRRERRPQGVVIGVNADGPVDHSVPVLQVASADGRLIAVVFGYACHCTTMDYYKWCGDYAGFAQVEIESRYPGATAMFVAGCGADINPHPRRSIGACRHHGAELAAAVEEVFAKCSEGPKSPPRVAAATTASKRAPDRGLQEVTGSISATWRMVDLPFAAAPDRASLVTTCEQGLPYQRAWARQMLARTDAGVASPTSYACPLQALAIGDALPMLFMAGEVSVEYARQIKQRMGHATWVAAYANDVMGYIPMRQMLREGGYEAEDAMRVYGLPAPWDAGVEERLISEACDLLGRASP